MGVQNSHDEDLFLVLFSKMLDDVFNTASRVEQSVPYIGLFSSRDVTAQKWRDMHYVQNRYQAEGLAFFTIALPSLGKWLDEMLNSGENVHPPKGFVPFTVDRGYVYPRFLQAIWHPLVTLMPLALSMGHATDDFALLVRQTRTLLYCFYKLELEPTESQREKAEQAFIANDEECRISWEAPSIMTWLLVEEARAVMHEILEGFNPRDIKPRHGPGAVSTGEKDEQKWHFSHLYPKLHQAYPYYDYMYGLRQGYESNYLRGLESSYRSLYRDDNPTSKVVFVPKDSRGPRTICAEPLEIQYIQQGLGRKLVRHLENRYPTRGQINFKDQTVNGRLALLSSKDRSAATLDLKDASDLVSLELVRAVCPDEIFRYLDATRSVSARLPSGRTIELKKFAPMGSALCFPVESLLFYAICVAARRLAGVEPRLAYRQVFVYGDDLIVPTTDAFLVINALEACGLRVNRTKCCYLSAFRESCGVDAWLGHVITPQRIKKMPARRPSEGNALAAWCSYTGHFWEEQKMHFTGEYCLEIVSNVMGFVPITSRQESYLSVVSPLLAMDASSYPRTRWNAKIQSLQCKLLCVRGKGRALDLDPHLRLYRNLVVGVGDLDPSQVVVRDATQTRQRWCNIPVTP